MTEEEKKTQEVLDLLAPLAPVDGEGPQPAQQVLSRLYRRLDSQQERPRISFFEGLMNRRYSLATALAIFLVAIGLIFPGVRAAASDFLGLFRVQKFAAISISPEQLAMLEEIAGSGLYPGQIEMTEEPGGMTAVSSVTEAAETLGWQVRQPGSLGDPAGIYVVDGGSGRLIIDVASARSLLAITGADASLIPDSLDGAPLSVTVYSGLTLFWDQETSLTQAPSPLVEYPDDVDVAAIGEVVLQALGLDPLQAADLARSLDWTNTLLLPVPENIASFNEVRVDGVTGLALSSLDGQNGAILWERDGIVYALNGRQVDELIRIGNSLR